MKTTVLSAFALALTVAHASAQDRAGTIARALVRENPNSARVGVYIADGDARDTLGVLVNSVVADGPAAKAGIKQGDRLQAINGVSLRLAKEDAEDEALRGMMGRRLIRELDKKQAGDEVEFRVWSDGAARTVRVKTVAAKELQPEPIRTVVRSAPGRATATSQQAAVGLSVGGSTSRRDTLGVFVMSVVDGGPAEKAGIVEGDRIARINGVDLRVPGPEAGEQELSRARATRFTAELRKLKAGDVVTLSVVSAGRAREVRVTTVPQSELPRGEASFFFYRGGDGVELPGGVWSIERPLVMPRGAIRGVEIPPIELPRLQFDRGEMERLQLRLDSLAPRLRMRMDSVLPLIMQRRGTIRAGASHDQETHGASAMRHPLNATGSR